MDRFAAKRSEILAAAGRCFARDGFKGASISAICAEALISPGHLYHYFESKEAIVHAMVDTSLSASMARFDRLIIQSDLVSVLLDEIVLVKGMTPSESQNAVLDKLPLEMMAEAARNPVVAGMLSKHSDVIHELLSTLLKRAQDRNQVRSELDADMAATAIMTVLDGAELMRLRQPDIDISAALETIRSMLAIFLEPSA